MESGVSAFAPGWVPGGWTQPPPQLQGRGREGAAPGGNRASPAPVLFSSSDRSRNARLERLSARRRYDSDAMTCLTIV
jgi:hypothetical protein